MRFRKVVVNALVALLLVQTALLPVTSNSAQAQSLSSSGLSLKADLSGPTRGAEFIAGDYPGAVLMSVNLWGGVNRPGIYHVPVKTDLLTLLSYAGGPSNAARLDEVTIKRRTGSKQRLLDVDVEDIVNSTGEENPLLEANDIVHIRVTKATVSDNTMRTLGFVSTILGIVAASLVLSNQVGK